MLVEDFSRWDTNEDGVLSRREVERAFQTAKVLNSAAARSFLKAMKTDGISEKRLLDLLPDFERNNEERNSQEEPADREEEEDDGAGRSANAPEDAEENIRNSERDEDYNTA